MLKFSSRSLAHGQPIALAGAATLGLSLIASTSALAQPGWGSPWGRGSGWGSRWDQPGWGAPMTSGSSHRSKDPREGRVQVSRFVRDDASADRLGHGYISITSKDIDNKGGDWVPTEARARYEAAVESALITAGYDTLSASSGNTQVATVTIRQRVLVPAEEKRNPVSGAAAMSVGTYGQSVGLAVNVDLSKARTALVSTRLDLVIKDKADGNVLWEGNAEIATYEGDEDWSDDKIATRLASALLDRFPEGEPVTVPITEIGIPQHDEPAGQD